MAGIPGEGPRLFAYFSEYGMLATPPLHYHCIALVSSLFDQGNIYSKGVTRRPQQPCGKVNCNMQVFYNLGRINQQIYLKK